MKNYFELPKLYKITNTDKVNIWIVKVYHYSRYSMVEVSWGQINGKKQSKTTRINSGKNLGKSNETSIREQAEFEAKSKWNFQKDKGYTEKLYNLEKPQTKPMLAHRFDKYKHKIKYPCYIQPKLDGIRCLASTILTSRKGKEFTSLPHILKAVRDLNLDFVLDGELYTHNLTFQQLSSIIRKENVHNLSDKVEYHIYDCILDESFEDRLLELYELYLKTPLKLVPTKMVNNESEVLSIHNKLLNQGYEGSILRNKFAKYESDKRSYNLQKIKTFMDDEFKIVGAKLNKNNECTFICQTEDKKEFGVVPEGSHEQRNYYWQNRENIIGKLLTVRFFEYTNECVPRFPVGVTVRNYE